MSASSPVGPLDLPSEPPEPDMTEKESFFAQVYSIQPGNEEEEEHPNPTREFLKRCKAPAQKRTSLRSQQAASSRDTTPEIDVSAIFKLQSPDAVASADKVPQSGQTPAQISAKGKVTSLSVSMVPMRRRAKPKLPALHRAISEPISDVQAKERPLRRKESLLRYDVLTPYSQVPVIQEAAPSVIDNGPEARRTQSDPSLGTLVMKNSAGITSMLGKRKKTAKKEAPLKMVPEAQQIFKGLVFYYVPADDIAALRRKRITKAREHGATWSKKFITGVTHIVVDNDLKREDVMTFLQVDSLPLGVIMVNEDYPIECMQYRSLEDASERQYVVKSAIEGASALQHTSDLPSTALPKPGHFNYVAAERQTPPREETQEIGGPYSPVNVDSQESVALEVHPEISISAQGREDAPGKPRLNNDPATAFPAFAENFMTRPGKVSLFPDELDEIIALVKKAPIDADDDDFVRDEQEKSEEEGYESPTFAPESKRKSGRKRDYSRGGFNQSNFTCMRPATGSSTHDANQDTVAILEEMGAWYTMVRDEWRSKAYRTAASQLKRQEKKICTYDEAYALPGIGDRLATKIEEIVTTGRLRRLESAQADPMDAILKLFLGVYQVGLAQATSWIQQGNRTLEDLEANVELTAHQRMGIEHYADLQQRMSRDEVAVLGQIVKENAASVDASFKVIIGGSYRRGAKTSGDIDCLITRADTTESQEFLPFLRRLVDQLTKRGFLVQALATPWHRSTPGSNSSSGSGSGSKWHGCCVLPGANPPTWRRIDFLLVPATQLGAALIYFTGDDIFNRSLRLLASKKGWRLNQRGLYKDVLRGSKRQKLTEGTLMEGADERRIFRLLDVPFREPHERVFA